MNTPHAQHLAALHRVAFDVATRNGGTLALAGSLGQCLRVECGLWPCNVTVGDDSLAWEVSSYATAAGVQVAWTGGPGLRWLSLETLKDIYASRAAFVASAAALMSETPAA